MDGFGLTGGVTGNAVRAARTPRLDQFFQGFADFGYLFEDSGIVSAVVIDDCSVEFFRRSTALTDLEIQDTVRSMSDRLHRSRM